MTIEAGAKLPAFSLPADDGRTYGPDDFAGRKLVLYFYPKDDTCGCTLEAQDLHRPRSPTSPPPTLSSSGFPRTA